MSGTKRSEIRYARRAELILNIGSLKEDLLRKVGFLKKQIEELCTRIEEERVSVKNTKLGAILNDYFGTLNARADEVKKNERTLEDFPIRTKGTDRELEKDQKALMKESDSNRKISDELGAIKERISNITQMDNIISKLETDFAEVERLMKNNRALLQEWAPKDYGQLAEEPILHKNRFDKVLGDIGSGKSGTLNPSLLGDIYKGLRSQISRIKNLVTDCSEKDHEVIALKNKIEKLKQDINEQAISAKDLVIRNVLGEYLNKLKGCEADILKKNYEGIGNKLDSLSNNLPSLRKADEINFNIETEMGKIESVIRENEAILRRWLKTDYESQLKETGNIRGEVDECKRKLQRGEFIDNPKLNNIFDQARNLSEKITSSLSIAAEKEKLHQKRIYIIRGLKGVCASLGFKELDEPHYKDKNNVYSSVSQSFDTLNLGTITFRVALEGKIESSSGITNDKCDKEFLRISELLKEQFGIETSFRRVDDGEPIKKYKTEEDLPTSAGKLSHKLGG